MIDDLREFVAIGVEAVVNRKGEGCFIDRKEERVEANLRAVIRLHDNTEIPCCIRDVSKSGARLGIPRGCILPKAFMFMINGRDFVFQARLAWQREPYAGVHIERIARLSCSVPG